MFSVFTPLCWCGGACGGRWDALNDPEVKPGMPEARPGIAGPASSPGAPAAAAPPRPGITLDERPGTEPSPRSRLLARSDSPACSPGRIPGSPGGPLRASLGGAASARVAGRMYCPFGAYSGSSSAKLYLHHKQNEDNCSSPVSPCTSMQLCARWPRTDPSWRRRESYGSRTSQTDRWIRTRASAPPGASPTE